MEGGLDKNQRPSEGRVEVEDGKLDFEELSDDMKIELILPRNGADERGPPGADIRDVPEASGTQQDWSHMETLHGAWPKWNRVGRPSGVLRSLGVWKQRPQEGGLTKMWKCEGLQLHCCLCIGRK